MKQDEMGWACDMYGGGTHTKWENVKGGGHLEDLSVDGRMIITTWIFKSWDESLKWIHQDCDRWLAVANAVTNFLLP